MNSVTSNFNKRGIIFLVGTITVFLFVGLLGICAEAWAWCGWQTTNPSGNMCTSDADCDTACGIKAYSCGTSGEGCGYWQGTGKCRQLWPWSPLSACEIISGGCTKCYECNWACPGSAIQTHKECDQNTCECVTIMTGGTDECTCASGAPCDDCYPCGDSSCIDCGCAETAP